MLYVCYGAKKSGSTLTYGLTKALLEEAGHPHIPLSSDERQDIRGHGGTTNTVRDWSDEVVNAALRRIPADHIVAFRTHHGPSEAIAAAVRSGLAKVQICVRDPRDLALSMWDVLKRHRSAGGERPGRSLDALPDMLRHVERNMRFTFAWAELGTPLVLNYEQTAFNPEVSLEAICRDLDLNLTRDYFISIFEKVTSTKNALQNKNAGRPQRHKNEMSMEAQQQFLSRFQDYYERFLQLGEKPALGVPPTTVSAVAGAIYRESYSPIGGEIPKPTIELEAEMLFEQRNLGGRLPNFAKSAMRSQPTGVSRTAAREARIAAREERIAERAAGRTARLEAKRERKTKTVVLDRAAKLEAKQLAKLEAKRQRLEQRMAGGGGLPKLVALRERQKERFAREDGLRS